MQASGQMHKTNYASFREAGDLAVTELHRLVDLGYLEEMGSWDDVLARWPDARAVRLAVVLKEKPDGSTKVRLILDALRNGTN
eukprot:9497120-Heterocapsa_arctica.AAC.1